MTASNVSAIRVGAEKHDVTLICKPRFGLNRDVGNRLVANAARTSEALDANVESLLLCASLVRAMASILACQHLRLVPRMHGEVLLCFHRRLKRFR